ncbi:MAG: hypothetical protein Q9182_000565 [Xanthomendoza sp. 2 TL-2023]
MLNNKSSAAAAAAAAATDHRMTQHVARSFSAPNTSEAGPDFVSMSDQSTYPARSTRLIQTLSYAPSPIHQPSQGDMQSPMPILVSSKDAPRTGYENGYAHSPTHPDDQQHSAQSLTLGTPGGSEAVKAFACGTCGKGFARRSDLARHERIHTGVRPHVCDHPGCDKQFIQRSALTVHARVHTGEKPHMCERCGKRFQLACQTSPYTLRQTPVQNHHTGTVEEAAAATAAALASRPPTLTQQTSSEGANYSDTASNTSTPSPGRRNSSISPSSEVPRMPNMNRQSGDYSYNISSGSLPHHLRHDLQSPSMRSSPSIGSPPLSSYCGPPPASNQHRPSLTSHPAIYGPPPVLEPPTHAEHRHSGSSGSSPHLSSVGWQSPIPGMGSPARDYAYPEPAPFAQSAPHLYYPNSNLRRPQSTEPDQYETKPRMVGGEVWAGTI